MYRGFEREPLIARQDRSSGITSRELLLCTIVFTLLFSASAALVVYNIEAIAEAVTLTDTAKDRLSWDPFLSVLGFFALFVGSCVFYFLVLVSFWSIARKTARAVTAKFFADG